jgi:hypothetical protein
LYRDRAIDICTNRIGIIAALTVPEDGNPKNLFPRKDWSVPMRFLSKWLFEGRDSKASRELVVAPEAASGTAEEYEEFRGYLSHPQRRFRIPGLSVAQEYALWRNGRARRA